MQGSTVSIGRKAQYCTDVSFPQIGLYTHGTWQAGFTIHVEDLMRSNS